MISFQSYIVLGCFDTGFPIFRCINQTSTKNLNCHFVIICNIIILEHSILATLVQLKISLRGGFGPGGGGVFTNTTTKLFDWLPRNNSLGLDVTILVCGCVYLSAPSWQGWSPQPTLFLGWATNPILIRMMMRSMPRTGFVLSMTLPLYLTLSDMDLLLLHVLHDIKLVNISSVRFSKHRPLGRCFL